MALPDGGRVRRLAHAFLAAADDDLALALLDLLISERDRTQARAADLVDAPGRRFDRYAGVDGGLTRRVHALRGGQDLPHDDLGDLGGLDLCAPHDFAHDGLAEIVRRHAAQTAVERADGRSRGPRDDDGLFTAHAVLLFPGQMPDIAVPEAITRSGAIVRLQSARVNRPARSDHNFFQLSAIFLDSPTVSSLAQSLSPGFRNAILE